MTVMIKHRVNRISDIGSLQPEWGAEIDLRSCVDRTGSLHLSHDPWTQGDPFEQWLEAFSKKSSGPVIINTKEDGLEARAVELLNRVGFSNFFFLDTALPTLIRWTMEKNSSFFAVRISAYESVTGIEPFIGRAEWAWLDCFGGIPLDAETVIKAKKDFKICLVSPELQGVEVGRISEFKNIYPLADAICTKSPESWIAL